MDSRKEKIWDNIATINVPDCFKVSTIGEMRKVYGISKNMPEKCWWIEKKELSLV